MLPVSLDCPFLIVHSVFSNVYLPVSLDCPFLIDSSVFSNVYLPVSLDCPFLIDPSVFSNVSLHLPIQSINGQLYQFVCRINAYTLMEICMCYNLMLFQFVREIGGFLQVLKILTLFTLVRFVLPLLVLSQLLSTLSKTKHYRSLPCR